MSNYTCLRCGYDAKGKKSSLKKHLQNKTPCEVIHFNRTRQELLQLLSKGSETCDNICGECNKRFLTFATYSYHCVNKVCRNRTDATVSSQADVGDTSIVEYGKEQFDDIPLHTVLDSFGTVHFEPDVIKYQYFNSNFPHYQNIVYLGKGKIAVKKRNGWESRPASNVIHTILHRMTVELVTQPHVKDITEIDEHIRDSIAYWNLFISKFTPRSPEYQRVYEAILHEIEKYSSSEMRDAIKTSLDIPY